MGNTRSCILAINPGSTSTKIALFENDEERFRTNIEHPAEEIAKYPTIGAQYEMRKSAVLQALTEAGHSLDSLSAIAARGACLPPLQGGAYRINQAMVDLIRNRPLIEHASNVSPLIAYELGEKQGIPSFIYDAISVDELDDLARVTGLPDLPRASISHALNMRAMAHKAAALAQRDYDAMNIIVTHLGGGITSSIHSGGRMIDIVSDDEGTFSPERAGKAPSVRLVDLCFSGQFDHATMRKKVRGKGGLLAHTGTSSAVEIERRIAAGDQAAARIYEAMAYQIAKDIGSLATVCHGKVDVIVLTGGIAHSTLLTNWIAERVAFIAPVRLLAGENELESLALGVARVLRGEEPAHEFDFV